jgi:hypothetical protein
MEIPKIEIRERGRAPRRLAKAYGQASKTSWRETGLHYHQTMRPKRFTVAHGKAAGYQPRKGDEFAWGTKQFWKSYVGRKVRKFKHRRPLVWSGETERRARAVNIVAQRNVAKMRYALNALNFHPWAQAEFRRILPAEAAELGRVYDANLDREIKKVS